MKEFWKRFAVDIITLLILIAIGLMLLYGLKG